MVIGDSITRSAIRIARSRGLGGAAAQAPAPSITKTIDESAPVEGWVALLGDGAVRRLSLSVGDINQAFERSGNQGAVAHPEPGNPDEPFIDLYATLVSVPAIGRSLLGRRLPAFATKAEAETADHLGSREWPLFLQRVGLCPRRHIRPNRRLQGESTIRFRDSNYERLGDLAADGAPRFSEIGLFVVPEGTSLDPTEILAAATPRAAGYGRTGQSLPYLRLGLQPSCKIREGARANSSAAGKSSGHFSGSS